MNISIKNLNIKINSETQIQSIEESNDYILERLSTYYGAEKEKEDIYRNIRHIELLLSDMVLLNIIPEFKKQKYNNTIHIAKSRLGM